MANNLIQIKRSATTAIPASLSAGELAYSNSTQVLYIGSTDAGATIVPIGGARNPGVLTANQALVANSTSAIDKIIVANLQPQGIYANNSLGTAGQVLYSNGSIAYWGSVSQGLIAGNGLGSNATHYFVNANNGIVANSTGTFVTGGSTITVNTTGVHVNTGNLSFATSQITSGNYVATLTSGNGVTASATSGTGSTPTLYAIGGAGVVVNASGINVLANNGISSNSTGTFVVAGNGLTVNSTGVHVGAANGITVAADSVAVNGGSTVTVNTTGVHVNSALSITSLVLSSFLNVGTQVNTATLYATTSANVGTALTVNSSAAAVSVNSTFSGANLVVSGANTYISSNVNFAGANIVASSSQFNVRDVVISGNLTVSGTTTVIDTVNIQVKDNMILLADQQGDTTTFTDAVDAGFAIETGNTATQYFSGLARIAASSTNTNPYFKLYSTTTAPNNTIIDTGAATGTLQAFLAPYGTGGVFVANSTVVKVQANATVNVAITANNLAWSGLAQNGVIYGGAGGAFTSLSAGAGGTVLMVSTAGVPEFATLDGGSF